ncbi:MAG: hypothetical protein DRJ42_15520 [Deltaproteobacteria bacterium]|nr:MAG: hypothetical protein DRJ42_15520 [Deltaproteobacteria bacterium]
MKHSLLPIALGAAFVVFGALLASCSARPLPVLGEDCSINTDCAAPLGCRIGACRRLCVESRDCGAGLRCLIREGESSGGCQLPEEAVCALNTDCPDGFSCIFATCTVTCAEDADCPVPGSLCLEEEPEGSGVFGCNEPLDEACIYDSDCPVPYSCAVDGSCQFECRDDGSDRDCPYPRECRMNICELIPLDASGG